MDAEKVTPSVFLAVGAHEGRKGGHGNKISRNIWHLLYLQCPDTVGWATGRGSSLEKQLDVGLLVVI